jgi:SRSO17 transposase
VSNCEIGVFAAYVSSKGHAFIDRALYLPKPWTDDATRRAAAHVPEEIAFATKPQLARGMIERAIASDVPFAWVAADSVYGVGEIEMMLRRQAKGYVLGVSGTHQFNSWVGKPEVGGTAEEIAKELDESAWQKLSAGAGTKGERLYDWAYCELADLEADEYNESLPGCGRAGS